MAENAKYTENLTYRKLDENGDYMIGVQGEMLTGLQAIAQAIKTRLREIRGEWWEGGDGTALPYFYGILGQKGITKAALDLQVIARIMDTVGVINVFDIASTLVGRKYSFSCKVRTVYGTTTAEVTA